jgi:diguanylate cyclase (GGDEF)-like protein
MKADFIGQLIDNKYKVLEKLGEGGMSVVFCVEDIITRQILALKWMKKSVTSSYLEDRIRFKTEMELAVKFNHPHIIKIFKAGEFENNPYIIMELLNGKSLADMLLSGRKFSKTESLSIVNQLVSAVDYVHNNGIIHRDIKPGNIFLIQKAKELSVKILDFGVAIMIELKSIKMVEEIVGTFGYMSPEATGMVNKRVDERSDLYSIGVILYHLMTGEMPFQAKEAGKILHQQVALSPKRPSKINPKIHPILEELILKLLNKEPDLRYQSAKGLLYDLEKIQKGEENFLIGEKDQKVKLNYQTRLIGRVKEMGQLKELFHNLENGKGSLCFIGGEAGSGKSRLVEEIKNYVYEKGGVFYGGRCLNQENKIPYQPFKDILDVFVVYVEKLEDKLKEKEIKRIKLILGDLQEVVVRLNSNMQKLLGEIKELVPLEPERENKRFLMTLAEFFCRLSREDVPCLIYLDDLQWVDESSLNLLQEVVSKLENKNIFILGTYRSNEIDEKHPLQRWKKMAQARKYYFEEIELKAMGHDALNELIAGILGEKENRSHGITAYILEKTDGNPFFAINVLRELVEEKTLIWKNGRWKEDWEKIENLPISANMVDIILRRIHCLSDELNHLLCVASVIGTEFELPVLFRLISKSKEGVVLLIDEAISLQLLGEGGGKGKYTFVHEKIKNAFYQKIREKERRILHLNAAHAIEEINEGDLEKVIFELIHHYFEANDEERVLKYFITVAEEASHSYANEEAGRYYEMGIKILEKNGQKGSAEWMRAREGLISVYLTMGKNDDAIEIALDIIKSKKTVLEKANTYQQIGLAYFKKGDWQNCENTLGSALKLLGEKIPLHDFEIIALLARELIVHVLHCILPGIFYHKTGKPVKKEDIQAQWCYMALNWMYTLSNILKMLANQLRMLNLGESRVGKSRELGMCLGAYACICMAIPLFKRAVKYHTASYELRKMLSDEWGIAQSLQWMGFCYCWMGHLERSTEYFNESLEKFQKIGDIWELGMVMNGLGYNYWYTSNYPEALYAYSKYLEISLMANNDFGIGGAKENLSHVYIEQGKFEQAGEALNFALNVSESKKDWFTFCTSHFSYGYLKLEQMEWKIAIEYLEKALKLEKSNSFLKDYTVPIYPLLAEAYIQEFKNRKESKNKKDLARIKKACGEALKETRLWQNHYGLALRAKASYFFLIGKNRKSEELFLKSIAHNKRIGRKYDLGKCYYEYGFLLKALSREEPAKYQWDEALRIFKEIGAVEYSNRCMKILVNEEKQSESPSRGDNLNLERRLSTVISVSRYLSSILDLEELSEKIMNSAMEITGASRGVLLLYSEEEKKLEKKVVRNMEGDSERGKETWISMSIVAKAEKNKEPVIIDNALTNDDFSSEKSVVLSGIKSVLCVPIMARGKMLGVIYLDNRMISSLFDKEDLEMLSLLCNQAGVSIENAQLYQRAVTDGLTELYNRAFFDNFLIQQAAFSQRNKKKISLMMIDLDYFKKVNDTYGHPAGDFVLQNIAKIIKNVIRKSDLSARYGGEEFVIVLAETGLDGALITAEKLRKMIEAHSFVYQRDSALQKIKVTVSVGLSELAEGQDRIDLLENADRALYQAKEKGRNRVESLISQTRIDKTNT